MEDADDINADDLAAFVDQQSKIEKDSSKNLGAFVEEEKYADGKLYFLSADYSNFRCRWNRRSS